MKLISIPLAAAVLLLAGPASAQFSATGTLTTDYDFRGVSQSDEDTAYQVSIDFEHDDGIYAGVWASTVDFQDCCNENLEVDWFAGYAFDVNDVSLDVGYNYYSYPGGDDLNYGEYYIGAAYNIVEVYYWYSDNFFNLDKSAFYLEGNVGLELPEGFGLELHLGYADGDGLEADAESGLRDYMDWGIAVTRSFGNFDAELRYVDTDLDSAFMVDDRVILSVSTTFPWGDE